MDGYEATTKVLSRIQSLDPENASKIMGYILIQDIGEKEMIRLAFGPETLLVSIINQAKAYLVISANTSSTTPSTPLPFNPINRPNNPFPQSSPRIIIPNNGFHINPSSPSSPWSGSPFPDHHRAVRPASSLSYAAVVNGTANNHSASFSSGSSPPLSLPFYNNSGNDLDNEYNNLRVQDQLSFLDEPSSKNVDFLDPLISPSGRSDSIVFPYGNNWVDSGNCGNTHHHQLHRRSCSVSDVFLGGNGSEDGGSGFGWRPCMYFARGFCKNGSSCKFLHGGFPDPADGSGAIVGSPSKLDEFDELLRMKALQQQTYAATSQLMAAGANPLRFNKCMNFFGDHQRSAAASLMMGEEFPRFGRCRPERNDFMAMGLGGNANSSSRQIYLTFPADSTFKEEDVSNYFSMYGPVQDVRIPYQQKRMFGFVTFVYPDTVKLILAKGNPHFVCDSRVLVKPYKEKGKLTDKKQQQQPTERGEFSACLSPSGLDSREPYDLPFGGRMFYNTQEMMLRRKLEEQAGLQQALELQGRRLMNLQLMDMKNNHNHHFQSDLLPSVPISMQSQSQSQINQSDMFPLDDINQEVTEESDGSQDVTSSPTVAAAQKLPHDVNEPSNNCGNGSDGGNGKEEGSYFEESDLHESLEHILPDNLFASPTKAAGDHQSIFSNASVEPDNSNPVTSSNNVPMLPTSSTLNIATLRSCYFPMQRKAE